MAEYQVRMLDYWEDDLGFWTENNSIVIGEIDLPDDFCEENMENILQDFAVMDITRHFNYPFADVSHLYLVDYNGDGTRYELWEKENDRPVWAFVKEEL